MMTDFSVTVGYWRRTVALIVDAIYLIVQVNAWTIEVPYFTHSQQFVVGRDPVILSDVAKYLFQTGDAFIVRMPVIIIANDRYADCKIVVATN